jgi:hypothetical protein
MNPFRELGNHIMSFLPNLATMLVILTVGIALAVVLRKLLARFLRAVRFNDLAYNIGFTAILFKSNIHQTPAAVIANIVYGVVLLLTFLTAVSALNLTVTSNAIPVFFAWIPNLIVSSVVLAGGYLLSKFIGRSVLLTAVNAEIRSARLISYSVQTLIMLFTISVSLEQIGLAQNTIIAAFSILFGGLVLALSIAFGLGGRDLARDFLERNVRKSEEGYSERHPFSHL